MYQGLPTPQHNIKLKSSIRQHTDGTDMSENVHKYNGYKTIMQLYMS